MAYFQLDQPAEILCGSRADGKPVGFFVLPSRTMPLIPEWFANTRRRP